MNNQVRFLYYRVIWISVIVLVSVTSFIFKPKSSGKHQYSFPYEFQLHSTSNEININSIKQPQQLSSSSSLTVQLKLLTFNILAPCYYKILHNNTKTFESEFKETYLQRNNDICNLLLESNADIICIQEFWIENEILRKLYQSKLGAKYKMKELPRTSHWRDREDGLAMFLHRDRIILQDTKDIRFHDCGDRVAQLLLLAIKPKSYESLTVTPTTTIISTPTSTTSTVITPSSSTTTNNNNNNNTVTNTTTSATTLNESELNQNTLNNSSSPPQQLEQQQQQPLPLQQEQPLLIQELPNQQFLCVNTHLLFPHNKGSTNIRVREMSKILDFVESYRQRELCDSICGRSDVRIPVIVAGDFNGTPKGAVFGLMKSQNFRSAHEECWNYGHHHGASLVANSGVSEGVSPVFANTVITTSSSSGVTATASASSSSPSIVTTIIPTSSSSSSSVLYPIGDQNQLSNNHNSHNQHDNHNNNSSSNNSNNHDNHNSNNHSNSSSNPWRQWVSHKSHQNQIIPVDHVFFCNPSDQIEEKLPSLPNWTNLVFREVMQRVVDKLGTSNMSEIFAVFDRDSSGTITREEFESALFNFGFRGDGTAALTPEEIAELIATADKNGDGFIDYVEFCERFTTAFENIDDNTTNNTNAMNNASINSSINNSSTNIKDTVNSEGGSIKQMRNAFKRSKWLSKDFQNEKLIKNTLTSAKPFRAYNDDEDLHFNHDQEIIHDYEKQKEFLEKQQLNTNNTSNNSNNNSILSGRPMGDLSVSSVKLYPKELESGVWPSNYTLSDHGIVEVIFTAQVLTNEQ